MFSIALTMWGMLCDTINMGNFVIYKSINNPLVADVTTTVPSIMAHWPGQMPSQKYQEVQEFMLRKPRKEAAVQKDYPRPVLTIEEIPRNLGFNASTEKEWSFFLNNSLSESKNEVSLRQDVFNKIREDRLDSEQGKVLVQKVFCYLRDCQGLGKSMVEVYKIEENKPSFCIREG